MEKDLIKFAVDEIKKVTFDYDEYDENEYIVCKILFLSTRENAHGLVFTEDVLRGSADTVLGKWIVAEIGDNFFQKDFKTHTPKQVIQGLIPKDQEVDFVKDEDGYLNAYVDGVISKRYASDACDIFERDGGKSVSVEFFCTFSDEEETIVETYNIQGITILGTGIRPSVSNANIEITRFSEEDANTFFTKVQGNRLTALERFAEERKQSMAEKKSYKVDKSKDAMSTGSWSDVDKTQLRNKIIEAKNAGTLVKSVYLKVDEDWKSAPSEKLHYPVMEFKGDTLVYNKNALSNAKARAVQNNESEVVKKIDKIYKSLDIGDDNEGKEETAKMSKEIEFAAVDIGDMWGKIYSALREHDGWRYGIEGIYEEDNKKFAVLKDEDGTLYRLDFSLTEEGMTAADELIEVQKEFIETDKVVRFAEPEDVEKYRTFAEEEESEPEKDDGEDDDDDDDDEKETKMSAEEMEVEMARLKKDIEERDNIIMSKDVELEELRAFKKGVEDKEKAMSVETVMEEIKGFVDENQFKAFREEGLACEMAEIDGWKNKVKAFCFEAGIKNPKNNKRDEEIFRFAMDVNTYTKSTDSLWD